MKFANKIWWSDTGDRIGFCGVLSCYKNLMFLVLKFSSNKNFIKKSKYIDFHILFILLSLREYSRFVCNFLERIIMIDLDDWAYALDNNRKKRQYAAEDFLTKVGYDFDVNKLSDSDSFMYDFAKDEIDSKLKELKKDSFGLKGVREPSQKVLNNEGSYQLASRNGTSMQVNITSEDNNLINDMVKYYETDDGEGLREHIYLDTNGYITTGIGYNVNNRDVFMDVDWRIDGRPATLQEKEEGYNAFIKLRDMKEYGQQYGDGYYKDLCKLRITQDYAKQKAREHTKRDLIQLKKHIEGFEQYPVALKKILLDFRYNTGNITREYHPRVREALDKKDLTMLQKFIIRETNQANRKRWILQNLKSIPLENGWHW